MLREARDESGLTLRALADRANTSHSAVASYESGSKHPNSRTLVRLIDAAGFAIDYSLSPRWREHTGLARGDELCQVLELAEQFPARHAAELEYPPIAAAFGSRRNA